ncbi:MAG: cob(I)yrinic acid a,c-diamide adenosyltransferase [Acidimicrobiia bacterium]|nr:cob(I)yrinic acid a,c-diamide adenosyltransferase [Acidimicrobiia bacterium]
MKVYTRKGDDGTTGSLYGERVAKDAPGPVACGDADEAQSALGLARAAADATPDLGAIVVQLQRDLYVAMGELATLPANRAKLTPGSTLVTKDMVVRLEQQIDDLSTRFEPLRDFVLPGETVAAAALDLARAIVRRAERSALAVAVDGSHVLAYLNRLSDLLWTMARWQEGEARLTKDAG